VRNGTTRVEVRAIDGPNAAGVPSQLTAAAPASVPADVLGLPRPVAPLPVSVQPPPPIPAEQMFVQVGAFTERDNAARLVERLRASGFVNPLVYSDSANGRTLHRVRLGPIRDSQEFDQLSARLRGIGVAGARLVVAR
jgi:rare lipoprotein A